LFGIGLPELAVIAIVALIVVGPKKLPELARSLDRAISELRTVTDDVKESFRETLKPDDVSKEVHVIKDSLLFSKTTDQEVHRNSSTVRDARGENPRKDSTLKTQS